MGGGQDVLEFQVDAVGPAEAYYVGLVAGGYLYVGRAAFYVVFFADSAVAEEVLEDFGVELLRDAGGVILESCSVETVDRYPGGGGPAEGGVPLDAGLDVGEGEAALMLEEVEVGFDRGGLCGCRSAGPERVERA